MIEEIILKLFLEDRKYLDKYKSYISMKSIKKKKLLITMTS